MATFTLHFEDNDPLLTSSQTVDTVDLDDAVAEVVLAIRDMVADHIRHGNVLTLRSVIIRDEDGQQDLKRVTVYDAIAELLPTLQA